MTKGNRKAKKLARQRKTKTGEAYTTSLMKNQIMESQIQAHANLEIEFKTTRPEIVELGIGRGASPIDTQVQEQLAMFGLIDERGRLKTEAIADSGLSEEYVRDIIENGVILPYLDQDGNVDMHRSMSIKPEKTKSEEGSDWRSEMVERLIAKYPIPEPHESLEISPRSGKSILFETQLRIAAAHGPVTVIDPKGNVDPQTLMFGRFLEDADPNEPRIPDLDWTDRGEYLAQRASYFRYQQINNGRECTENQLSPDLDNATHTIIGIGGDGKFRGFRILSDSIPTIKDIDWNILRHIGSQNELEAWVDERIAGGGIASLRYQKPLSLEPVVYDLNNIKDCHVIQLSLGVDKERRYYAEDRLAFWWEENRHRFGYVEDDNAQRAIHAEFDLEDTGPNFLRLDVDISIFEPDA